MIRTYLSIVSEQQYHNLIKLYALTVTIVSSDPTSSRSHHIVINVVTLLWHLATPQPTAQITVTCSVPTASVEIEV